MSAKLSGKQKAAGCPHGMLAALRSWILLSAILSGCAGNYTDITGGKGNTTNSNSVDSVVGNLPGVRVSFHFSDYYSLSTPREDSYCAGDVKNYYHALGLTLPSYPTGAIEALGGSTTSSGAGFGTSTVATGPVAPLKFPPSLTDSSTTAHPAFLKNVSVDLTNSNSTSALNGAYRCSMGSGPSIPEPSSCATFDYGAIGGLPTNMGGSILLIGGLADVNYSGKQASVAGLPYHGPSISCGPQNDSAAFGGTTYTNACNTLVYALGINTLPASAATNPPNSLAPGVTSASGPLSTWANLTTSTNSTTNTYTGPKGMVGAAIAYNLGLQHLLTFGGSSPLSGGAATDPGAPTNELWSLDIKSQAWTTLSTNSFVDTSIQVMPDVNPSPSPAPVPNVPQTNQWQKPPGGRFDFGYQAAQGFALSSMSALGNGGVSGNIDLTDRILIVGGVGSYGYDTRRFNPTYGPDWIETTGVSPEPAQWLDSYHTQVMFNHDGTSGYLPVYGNGSTAYNGVNFALAAGRNNTTATGAGYLFAVGGFISTGGNNTSTATGGSLNILWRGTLGNESLTSNYATVPNFPDGLDNTPEVWSPINEAGLPGGVKIPWYGASSLIPGFNTTNNEFVYFGGTSCPNYLSTAATGCTLNASSDYWTFGSNPGANAVPFAPTATIPGGTAPQRAGMAAARGLDPAGNPILIAFGGASAGPATLDQQIHYLYNNGGTPTWVTQAAINPPTGVAEGALVFSHVTRKFYLFGGYSATSKAVNADTWELTITSTSNATCTTSGTCTFTWKQLSSATCYPSCPQARRSHRMTEVNYYNRNINTATMLPINANGEGDCTDASKPCSFGIFMEGGTPDGTGTFADRWMFDPTANGGRGHWQQMTELPPRNLAAMTALDYYVPTQNKIVHRGILFGGETGMQNPQMAADAPGGRTYFVPPTLGDTWMYDFDQNTWNRVRLLGKGYNHNFPDATFATTFPGLGETDARESFKSTPPLTAWTSELSPPPVSGAVMVTRTVRNKTHKDGDPVTALAIPEVFLFGGRLKDGSYMPLNQVYKFCAGSTGEKPFFSPTVISGSLTYGHSQSNQIVGDLTQGGVDDASCDSYDATFNPYSPSPTQEYKGRWIRKKPAATASVDPSLKSSYLGKAVYDPFRDTIILVGGLKGTGAGALTPDALPAAVPQYNSATPPYTSATLDIVEYTPPSSTNAGLASNALSEGVWTTVPTCSSSASPAGRYAHSLSYDLLNHQLVMIGGYSSSGAPLTQTVTYYDGRTYSLPEVWTAKYDAAQSCYTWTQITLFSNSIDIPAQTPPMSGLSHAASIFVPADGYNSGFYTLLDKQCVKAGPIGVPDDSINKLLAGGVYFDLDRTKLKDHENLLLHLKFIPMGPLNIHSDSSAVTPSETAIFKVHLVKTGLALNDLRLTFQPRYMLFSDTDKFPEIVHSIAVLTPPGNGQVHEEQILLPISMDPDIDRIRIERYSGSGILIDATLYRLGPGNL